MTHLSNEQIEQVLQMPEMAPEHLQSCPLCQGRLAEAEAMRSRLRRAFGALQPDDLLAEQVRAGLRRHQPRWWHRIARGSVVRVAAMLVLGVVLLVAVPVAGPWLQPTTAHGAHAELVQIHQANLLPHMELHAGSSPEDVASYFKRELGLEPAMPQLGVGMALRGCCVAYFRDRPVGSYVVESDRGVISVIVLPDSVDSLEMSGTVNRGGRTYRTGTFARSHVAAVEANGYTYAAVGEVEAEWLIELLETALNVEPA